MKKVTIYSDGGCHGNPGPGAWAAVLQYGKHVREITGGTAATTNNRMELMAAIESLNLLKEACEIDFHTDSEYVRNGITQWLAGWKRNGWRTAAKKPVKNADLWQQLDAANARHQVRWHWVKGHAGNDLNERCDELVQQAIAKVKEKHGELGLAEALQAFKAAEG
jgi:ribonuclease HI